MIGVTGSTGKTSTKDLLHALLAPHRRTVASRANFNTEIGLPLEILAAPAGTEVLVLEMAMRGAGQIAELAAIAEPDVGVIVSVGPVHLELLGTVEAIAAAKAELIAGLRAGARPPSSRPASRCSSRTCATDVTTVTFGDGRRRRSCSTRTRTRVMIDADGELIELEVPFTQAHLRRNLLAAVAAARAVGVHPAGRVELALSPGRGQRARLPDGVIADRRLLQRQPDVDARRPRRSRRDRCRAAGTPAAWRCSATCSSSGPASRRYHVEIGGHAAARDVDVLVTVGPLAAAMADRFDGESHPRRRRGRGGGAAAGAAAARRRRAGQGLARRRARGRCAALQAGVA